MKNIIITDFCKKRHFLPNQKGTYVDMETWEFLNYLRSLSDRDLSRNIEVIDRNIEGNQSIFAGTRLIPEHGETFLMSHYETRRQGELPYLTRALHGLIKPHARYMQVILYSQDQLKTEGIYIDADYGVVSVNARLYEDPEPPTPATLLRNALGKEYGGNGQPLDRDAYMASVEYWDKHAIVA